MIKIVFTQKVILRMWHSIQDDAVARSRVAIMISGPNLIFQNAGCAWFLLSRSHILGITKSVAIPGYLTLQSQGDCTDQSWNAICLNFINIIRS